MGSWGEGMQANDTALDFVASLEGKSKKKALAEFRKEIKHVDKVYPVKKDWYGGNHQAILGMADYLLDMEFGIPKDLLPKIESCIDNALTRLESWRNPSIRKDALLRFQKKLHGEKVDKLDLELDNMGLMSRIGLHDKSRDEIKKIIKNEEKKPKSKGGKS